VLMVSGLSIDLALVLSSRALRSLLQFIDSSSLLANAHHRMLQAGCRYILRALGSTGYRWAQRRACPGISVSVPIIITAAPAYYTGAVALSAYSQVQEGCTICIPEADNDGTCNLQALAALTVPETLLDAAALT
jgi:hypothetical protein